MLWDLGQDLALLWASAAPSVTKCMNLVIVRVPPSSELALGVEELRKERRRVPANEEGAKRRHWGSVMT